MTGELGRPLTLIAESDLNDPVMITPRAGGGYGLDAQWDDDVHHALHAALTGERQGYYCDFGLDVRSSRRCSPARSSTTGPTPVSAAEHTAGRSTASTLPGHRFVVCLQNHDQVGNRAVGDRLPELTSPALLRVGARAAAHLAVHPDALDG